MFEDQERKGIIVFLRWAVISVMFYLLVLEKGRMIDPRLGYLLLSIYVLSNITLAFLPKPWFYVPEFFYSLVLFDTAIAAFGMALSEKMATDFYLVFFLILIFASLHRNYRFLMMLSGVTAAVYGIFLYRWGLLASAEGSSHTLRVFFILIVAAFYGYLVQTFSKERQKQLAISEDKYRGLFENANDGIILLKSNPLHVADMNREAERLTGFRKEEFIGKGFPDLFKPEERGKAQDYLDEVVLKGEGWTDLLSLSRKEGTSIEVDLSGKRIDFGEDTFFQIMFRDLTEKRKLEKKIRESKRNLEAIFDGIRDQLSLQAPNYQILRVNRAVAEKHRSDYRDLIGKTCYETYYRRSEPCKDCPVTVTIQTRQPACTLMKNPEENTSFRIFSYPILDEKENLVSVIECTQDVTEEQRLQDQLIQSEKLAGIGVLASGVAHEINNPLSGIMGMAELAMEEDDPESKKAYVTDILNCAQRIGEITKGLRSYSRISKQAEQAPMDVNEVLESSLRMVRMGVKTSPVEVIKKLQPVEKIEASSGEIQQVFTNLITNAFQAMNGAAGKLSLFTRQMEDLVEIKVTDTGGGIPEKNLKKIFDPFFTTKKQGEGTGLGLNIVYRIVTKYEGTIDVESQEGVGTTFTVRFPSGKTEVRA
jgi:PAS domain S-box-containing protein